MGVITDNGKRLVYLCEVNNLVTGGTIFKYITNDKLSRTSPLAGTETNIFITSSFIESEITCRG